MTLRKTLLFALTLALAATLFVPGAAFAKTKITIKNGDGAGEGFNDPTPVAPVGGNSGTTLGQQRMISFQAAADVWSDLINSDVEIIILAKFDPLPCTSTSAVLGQASPKTFLANFVGAPKTNVWYPVALANALVGHDLNNGAESISAQFNSSIDSGCFGGEKWYYGLDGNHGTDDDLMVTLLHEFGHGLGFSGATDSSSGAFAQARPSLWDYYTYDAITGLHWSDETAVQRVASIISGKLAWDGPLATTAASKLLKDVSTLPPSPQLNVGAVKFDLGTASFGSVLTTGGLSGALIGGTNPATAPATGVATDGCTAYTNAGSMAGKIVVVDRGTCNFTVKAKFAQDAGAIAAVIIGKAEDCAPFGLGGSDDTVHIPTVSLSSKDGAALRALMAQGAQSASFGVFTQTGHLAGADAAGHPLLYSPCVFVSGSSVYHFDTSATPNLLMEPNINSDLSHNVDLTLYQLQQLGWSVNPPAETPQSVVSHGRLNIRKHP